MSKKQLSNVRPSQSNTTINHITSKCCHQFIIFDGLNCICSGCRRLVTTLKNNETLTIGVKYNAARNKNTSADVQNSYKLKAKRFATDPLNELFGVKCPLCNSLTRYTRDPQGNFLLICSNPDCRNVFYPNE